MTKLYLVNLLTKQLTSSIYCLAILLFLLSLLACNSSDHGLPSGESYITDASQDNNFLLSSSGFSAPLCISSIEYQGVERALQDLKADIGRVTNVEPDIYIDNIPSERHIVLVGTLGKSPLIDSLVNTKKINVSDIAGKWETFLIQVVEKPFTGIDKALVIVGSDRRGTIFGIYDVSAEIGVSPWYWWADVPILKKNELYVLHGRFSKGEPKVKYRGIFINNEAPALAGWAEKYYNGFTSGFYEKVFELILRMKGNYLWPAMWSRAFYVDDPLNPKIADEYGIVIGTTHHEPMMRAHVEWRWDGTGEWNYETNKEVLQEFWREGIRRMDNYESTITVGMRGDGDEPMTTGTHIELLERIIHDQREILKEEKADSYDELIQIWALYKEVQDYYDQGMRVPDDVMLLLCNDNWGNVRKLPKPGAPPRSGGYGMYYHFDYVGGPRNYKWINTNQISRIWEQMHLTYRHGVDRLWLVNVGDIKPMELPIEFFLDFAWDPDKWMADKLPDYHRQWAAKQFGDEYAKDIGRFLAKYTKFNSRRKPELLSPETYSLIYYQEAEIVVNDYNSLAEEATKLYEVIPEKFKDAYYQLVLYPIVACANINELYYTVGKNRLYASQGRVKTNELAKQAKALFNKDAELTYYFNNIMADGKWSHMMDQTRIGYTYWQQPPENVMPDVQKIEVLPVAAIGLAIEGEGDWWPESDALPLLPEFDKFNQQTSYIELFNRGTLPFSYQITTEAGWVYFSSLQGTVEDEIRILVSIDWINAPFGNTEASFSITGSNDFDQTVWLNIFNTEPSETTNIKGFVESNGYISMEAENFSRRINANEIHWEVIPNLGRTKSGITTFPVTAPSQTPGNDSPYLEYNLHLFSSGEITVHAYLSPTLNFYNTKEGLRYGISINDGPIQIISLHDDESYQEWSNWVSNNINIQVSKHVIDEPGNQTLKFWMVDPGVVLQKIVVDTDGLKPSYLGPPESYKKVK